MQEVNIYYINLKRSTDRREAIERSFLQDNFIRIEAIDGTKWTNGVYDEYGRLNWNQNILRSFKRNSIVADIDSKYNNLFPVEVACNLSHAKAWIAFLEDENDWGIVLEDDVEPSLQLGSKSFNEAFQPIPNADMIYLCSPQHPGNRISLYKDGQIKWARTLMGYAITKKAAKLMLEAIFPMCYLADCQIPVRLFESLAPFRKNWVHESLLELKRFKAYGSFNPLIQHSEHAKVSLFSRDGVKKWIPKENRL